MGKFFQFLYNALMGSAPRAHFLEVVLVNGKVFVRNQQGKLGILDENPESCKQKNAFVGKRCGEMAVRTVVPAPDGAFEAERVCKYRGKLVVRYFKDGEELGYGIMKVKHNEMSSARFHAHLKGWASLPVFKYVD